MPLVVMRLLALFALVLSAASASLYDLGLEADDLRSGLPVPLDYYRGKVLLVVNVASQCGSTETSYRYLNQLHERYAERGLAILAFPCNQFGNQEPGGPEEISAFTRQKKVSFDLFRKVDVNGATAHPLFKFLRGEGECSDDEADCEAWAASGECDVNEAFMHASCRRSCKLCTVGSAGGGAPIRWNFESFLVSRTGEVHTRWGSGTELTAPDKLRTIEALLVAKSEL